MATTDTPAAVDATTAAPTTDMGAAATDTTMITYTGTATADGYNKHGNGGWTARRAANTAGGGHNCSEHGGRL